MLGNARIPIQIDVGFGDTIVPPPKVEAFPTPLSQDSPRLRMYPPETVIAEKLEAIVTLGITNSRMKDYYDLLVILQAARSSRPCSRTPSRPRFGAALRSFPRSRRSVSPTSSRASDSRSGDGLSSSLGCVSRMRRRAWWMSSGRFGHASRRRRNELGGSRPKSSRSKVVPFPAGERAILKSACQAHVFGLY